jgi:hypothetical protein
MPNCAIFLSAGSFLVTVGFGASEQLLNRVFSFRHDGGWKPIGRVGRNKRKRESTRSNQFGEQGAQGGFHALEYLSEATQKQP